VTDGGTRQPNQLGGAATPNQLGGQPTVGSPQRSEEPTQAPADSASQPGELAGLVTPPPQYAAASSDQPGQPAQPQWQAPPAKKGPAWGGIAARVGIIGAIVVGGLVLRDRLTGDATDLRVGDCFDEPANTATEISEVQHQPCTEPHDGEVMFVGEYPNQTTCPGQEAFTNYIRTNCLPAFESYVGRDYESDTELDIGWLYPTAEGWPRGDHEISCYVFRLDDTKLTQSVKGLGAPAAT
jgi:hypothetical protein